VVTVELAVAYRPLARVGGTVRLTLPDGRVVDGTIAAAVTVVDPGDAKTDPTTKVEVTVTSAGLTGFDQATLTVGFTASERKGVLTVPVAALLALADGGYGVQVLDGATPELVPVRTGLFASGRVEVSGALSEGTTVGMPA
jgi:hypothetical protein